MENKEKIISVENLAISFKTDQGIVHAVRNVSFDLSPEETLCIVGESGSGKSVTSKAIMGILANNAIIEGGKIMYHGENLLEVSEEEFHRIRGHKIGMIFQDPLSSLNPIVRIGKQITEAMLINSNKLKLMYEDLISKELTQYKNTFAKRNSDIRKARNKVDNLIAYYNDQIRAVEKETNKINNEIYDKKKELILFKQKCNAENNAKANKAAEQKVAELNDYITACKNKIKVVKDETNNINNDIAKRKIEFSELAKNKSTEKAAIEAERAKLNEFIASSKKEIKSIQLPKDFNKNMKSVIKEKNAEIEAIKAKCLEECSVETNKLFEKENVKLNEFIATCKEKIKSIQLPQEFFQKMKSDIKEKEVEFSAYKKKRTKEQKIAAKPLKEVLVKRQKEAKVEVKKYKQSVLEEEKTKILEARNRLDALNNSYDTNSITEEQKKELDEKRKAIKAEIQNIKIECIYKLKITRKEAKRRAIQIMNEVGIPMPERRFRQYPFEFSGGMRQRIVIAIALTASPEILICDEPTTALDVTIQAQILELIKRIQKEKHIACIFITHDLGVVANMADRIAVMYAGKIVEYGKSEEIFFEPKHPYTWALLSSIPDVDSKERLEAIPGTPPNMIYPPKGDAFALRSRYAMKIDFEKEPPFFKVSDTHYAATWLMHEDAPKVEMPKIVSERIRIALEAKKKEEDSKNKVDSQSEEVSSNE